MVAVCLLESRRIGPSGIVPGKLHRTPLTPDQADAIDCSVQPRLVVD